MASLASPLLGDHFFLLQQLSREGVRNPQPIELQLCIPVSLGGAGDGRGSQTFPIPQPNVTSSLEAQLGEQIPEPWCFSSQFRLD